MTEQDKPDRREEYKDQSAAKLAHEVLRLLLVLVWRIILWCIKKVCKGLLWCLDITEKGWDRLHVWWHDNDTQAKVAKIKAGVRNGAKAAGHYALVGAKTAIAGISIALVYAGKWALIGLKATGRGIVVAMKATLQGLLHTKSTAKRLYRLSRVGMRKLKAWNKRRKRQARLSKLKRERAYRQFKANGGMKGVLLNTSNGIKNRIAVFMEEDQDEPGEEAVTEDDLFEESLERGAKEGSKPMEIGKNIVSRVKDLVDPE